MIRKNFIESETQKMAKVLARILGLKSEGELDEAIELAHKSLAEEANLSQEFLNTVSVEDFKNTLGDCSESKIQLLSQLIFETAHPFDESLETRNRLHLVLTLFNLLEDKFHTQSLENLNLRQKIEHFLSKDQYE